MSRVIVNRSLEAIIGGRLFALRKAKNISQAALGAMMDMTPQQISKYEKGSNRLPASTLMGLCKKLNTSPSYFFADLDESFVQENALINAYRKLDPHRRLNALRFMKDMQQPGDAT